jgi:hypothetical protein
METKFSKVGTVGRDADGRYAAGLARMCRCGHTLGQHAGLDGPIKLRPCVCDEGCECEGFRVAKVSKL